jgi:hexosaminidase
MDDINQVLVIPKPNKINLLTGYFIFDSKLQILTPSRLESPAKQMKNLLQSVLKMDCEFIKDYKELATPLTDNLTNDEKTNSSKLKRIVFGYISSNDITPLGNEGYILDISPNNIIIKANTPAGAFYAVQTIKQMLLNNSTNESTSKLNSIQKPLPQLPCLVIQDIPRFPWRGYMLDEGRHFHGMNTVKRILDIMALLKLNTFHWHLTEDQGWRIQIKKYPKLTEVGSRRSSTQVGGFISKKYNGVPHEGYYTQDQIKEIIAYARERYITIIPEIDIPGHSTAALASYPEFSCTGGPFQVSTKFGIHKEIYCVGKEATFHFIEDILSELMNLFPSPIIHIGGDEVPKDRWKVCPDCQKRLETENLTEVEQLQSYFTNRITSFLQKNNHKLMGWSEILKGELSKDVITQFWIGDRKRLLNHIQQGGNAVMSDFKYCYLDHWYEFTSLDKSYAFEPIPKELKPEYQKNVLGIEGLMWNEWVPNTRRLDWQTFPRLIAFAEVGWTEKENKDLGDFKCRLDALLRYFDALKVGYASKKEWNPNWFKRLFSIITLLRPPNKPK